VPFLDTTFVVLKRLKYRRPVYIADAEHFHHRMARIGFSVRRSVIYLYGWTMMLAGLALALRFIPYATYVNHHRVLHTGWTLVLAALGVIVALASVYLIYVLEIVKFRGRGGAGTNGRQPPAALAADGATGGPAPPARASQSRARSRAGASRQA
jgi:hypothetical protein